MCVRNWKEESRPNSRWYTTKEKEETMIRNPTDVLCDTGNYEGLFAHCSFSPWLLMYPCRKKMDCATLRASKVLGKKRVRVSKSREWWKYCPALRLYLFFLLLLLSLAYVLAFTILESLIWTKRRPSFSFYILVLVYAASAEEFLFFFYYPSLFLSSFFSSLSP
ncbi:hypothetical protein BCR43DRAFT_379826 [Syncephalastrum racemosum]|uniref:Uncharacterized protein n=1 Tax=Syncephalastrum racemosum TaxID=13706 RepID=A0A1X2H559_SYNRA|nr:hypothetical protein BCR43DRAFT_379826 [Syncephalastrum racemosum]